MMLSRSSFKSKGSSSLACSDDTSTSSKKPKGLRRLLDRNRSFPPVAQQPVTSPSQPESQTGSQEELSRVLPQQSGSSSGSPGSTSTPGQRRTPISTGASPSPQHGYRGGMPTTSATSSSSSIFSAGNITRSPIKDVIMEEEYEDPADVSRRASSTDIDSIADPSPILSPNGIYSEPCDIQKRDSSIPNNGIPRELSTPPKPAALDIFPMSSSSVPPSSGRLSAGVGDPPPRHSSTSHLGTSVAPQGNVAVLDHHPASAFERLPRQQSNSTALVPVTSHFLHPPPPGSFTNDEGPPMYEEAWDLKMNRLGLDMGRLSHDHPSSSTIHHSVSPAVEPLPAPTFPPPPPPPHHTSTAEKIAPVAFPGHAPFSGSHLQLHQRSNPVPVDVGSLGQSDYDYAYNKAWKLNVEMSLNMNLKQPALTEVPVGQSGPLDRPLNVPGGVTSAAEFSTVPTPQSLFKGGSQSESQDAEEACYEEPWDVKHGRMIAQLSAGKTSAAVPPTPPPHGVARSWSRQSNTSLSSCVGTDVDKSLLLEDQPWFHGGMTRGRAEDVIHSYRDGSYLVRRSETNHSDFSLTIKRDGSFLHMKISKNAQGQYVLGQYSQPYSSVPVMIDHYSRNLLPIKGAVSMTLKFPIFRSSGHTNGGLRSTFF